MRIKMNLRQIYKEKLKTQLKKPQSSPGYQKRLNKIQKDIEKINLGSYTPTKSDLNKVKKIASPRTKKTIEKALKTFDTDNQSFHAWNTSKRKSKYVGGGVDMAVKVKFQTIDNETQYRHYGIISNRIDGKVSDEDIHEQITYDIQKEGTVFTVKTGSGHVSQVKSYQILTTERD